MTSPKIRISNSDEGFSGHWWADVDDGDGNVTRASFGPKEITSLRGALGALGFPVDTSDGEFRSGKPGPGGPFNRTSDEKMDRPRNQVTIPIDRAGYQKAMERISAWKAAGSPEASDYRGTGVHPNNCIDATQDITTAAGVPDHIADYFPTDTLEDSLAGRQAMRRAGVRAGEQGSVADFPDMAFPWMPTRRDQPPVSVRSADENGASNFDVTSPTWNPTPNLFNSDSYARGVVDRTRAELEGALGRPAMTAPAAVDVPPAPANEPGNLLNANALPANLLNMSPEELRRAMAWSSYAL